MGGVSSAVLIRYCLIGVTSPAVAPSTMMATAAMTLPCSSRSDRVLHRTLVGTKRCAIVIADAIVVHVHITATAAGPASSSVWILPLVLSLRSSHMLEAITNAIAIYITQRTAYLGMLAGDAWESGLHGLTDRSAKTSCPAQCAMPDPPVYRSCECSDRHHSERHDHNDSNDGPLHVRPLRSKAHS